MIKSFQTVYLYFYKNKYLLIILFLIYTINILGYYLAIFV